MYYMTFAIYHYILVVPVLDLKNIAYQRVSSEGVQESFLRSFEALALFLSLTETLNIEFVQRLIICPSMYLIQAHSIINVIDEPTVWTSRYDLIGLKPKREFFKLENLFDLTD